MSRSKDWNLLRRCIQKGVLFFITPDPLNHPFWCGSSSYCAQYFFMSVRLAISANVVFLIQICNEWNKRIFCYRNQWVSCWRINIKRWRQREYRYSNISDKTVNWILAAGKVRERYIRKGNKNRNKIERWIIFAGYFGLQHKPSTGTKTKRVQI